MTNSIDSILRNESLFAAVGSAHIGGRDGIVQLLKDKGFKLSLVHSSFTGETVKKTDNLPDASWQSFTDEKNAFSIDVPSQPFDFTLVEEIKDSKMSVDLGNGIFYIYFSIKFPVQGKKNKEKMFDRFTDNYEKIYDKIEQKKKIEVDGVKGIEFIGYQNSFFKTTLTRVRILIRDGQVLLLGAGGASHVIKNKKSTQKFFNSLKWLELKYVEADNRLKNQTGAFATTFPTEPVYRKTPSAFYPEDPLAISDVHLWVSVSSYGQFMVRYNDQPSGYVFEDLEYAYSENANAFSKIAETEIELEDVAIGNVTGKKFSTISQGMKVEVHMYIRGNRFYMFFSQGYETEKFNASSKAFFESIEFTPMEQTPPQLKRLENCNISFSTPGTIRSIHQEDGYDDDEIHLYASKDSLSGDQWLYSIETLSPYYYCPSGDSFLQSIKGIGMMYNDTILYSKIDSTNGIKFLDELIHVRNANQYRYSRAISDNSTLYSIEVYTSTKTSNPLSFFDYLNFKLEARDTNSIYVPKFELLINDLESSDTNKVKKAKEHLRDFLPAQSELKAIQQKLLEETNSTEQGWNSQQSSLLDLLGYFKSPSDSINEFYEEYYFSNDSSSIKSDILVQYLNLDSSAANTFILELIEKQELPSYNYYPRSFFWHYNTSSQLFCDNIDQLSKLKEYNAYHFIWYQLLRNAIQDTNLTMEVRKSLFTNHHEDFKNQIMLSLNKDSLGIAENRILNHGFHLYSDSIFYDNEILQQYLNSKHQYQSYRAIESFAEHGIKIPSDKLNQILEGTYYRASIMRYFLKNNQPDQIPSKYWKQKELSAFLMINYINEYDYLGLENSDIKKSSKHKISIEEKSYAYYSYEIKTEDNTTIIGIQGPFEKGKKYQLNDDLTNYRYNPEKDKDEVLKELIKESLEWMKSNK